MAECDCGAPNEGKWADVHAMDCASRFRVPAILTRQCHELAEAFIETDLIGLDHASRCLRLGVLLQETAEEWMKANPPVI